MMCTDRALQNFFLGSTPSAPVVTFRPPVVTRNG